MSERVIHPIEHQIMTDPKTVIDLLNEHYGYDTNCTAEVPDARTFNYVEYIAALMLGNRTLTSIEITARAHNFAVAIGNMVGFNSRIIETSKEFASSISHHDLRSVAASETDDYVANNLPTMNLVDAYRDKIDQRDEPDVLAVRAVTATIMRQMQQGNEKYTTAREIASLETLLTNASNDQRD